MEQALRGGDRPKLEDVEEIKVAVTQAAQIIRRLVNEAEPVRREE